MSQIGSIRIDLWQTEVAQQSYNQYIIRSIVMMSSKVFDPPVYKETYSSGLRQSTHAHKSERIRCCGLPCWAQILIWSTILICILLSAVFLHRKYYGKRGDNLLPEETPVNRRMELLKHYMQPMFDCPDGFVLDGNRCRREGLRV